MIVRAGASILLLALGPGGQEPDTRLQRKESTPLPRPWLRFAKPRELAGLGSSRLFSRYPYRPAPVLFIEIFKKFGTSSRYRCYQCNNSARAHGGRMQMPRWIVLSGISVLTVSGLMILRANDDPAQSDAAQYAVSPFRMQLFRVRPRQGYQGRAQGRRALPQQSPAERPDDAGDQGDVVRTARQADL